MAKKIALITVLIAATSYLAPVANAQRAAVYSSVYDPYAPIGRQDGLSPQCSLGSYWQCPLCAQTGIPRGCYCSCQPLPGVVNDPLNPPGAIRPNDPPSLQQWWYVTRLQAAGYQPPGAGPILLPAAAQPLAAAQFNPVTPVTPNQGAFLPPPRDPAYENYLAQWWQGIWR